MVEAIVEIPQDPARVLRKETRRRPGGFSIRSPFFNLTFDLDGIPEGKACCIRAGFAVNMMATTVPAAAPQLEDVSETGARRPSTARSKVFPQKFVAFDYGKRALALPTRLVWRSSRRLSSNRAIRGKTLKRQCGNFPPAGLR